MAIVTCLRMLFFAAFLTTAHALIRGLLARDQTSDMATKIKVKPVTLKLKYQYVPKTKRHLLAALSISRRTEAAARAPSSVTVGLRQEEGWHAYYGSILVGSESQHMTMVFDTGSANLIVPSWSCKSCKRIRFDPSQSSTGGYLDSTGGPAPDKDHSRQASVSYTSGTLSGDAYQDTVCVGDDDGMCAQHAHFLLADDESANFQNYSFDGILGLSPPRAHLSLGDGFSLLDDLVDQKVVPARVTAFHLSGSSSDGLDDSEVTIGGFDETRTPMGLTWLRVIEGQGAWEVHLQDISVGGSRLGICDQGVCSAVFDSGCPGIGLPWGLGSKIAKRLGFNDEYGTAEQCRPESISKMPQISFQLDGHSFDLSPQDYVEVSTKDASHCRLHLRDMNGAGIQDPIVLGHPFLVRFYSVYDRDNLRVGLAASF